MQTEKKDIRALSKEQLRQFFVANGDKPFRGNQVYEWLWSKRAHTFEDMTNLSKETRTLLENNFTFHFFVLIILSIISFFIENNAKLSVI